MRRSERVNRRALVGAATCVGEKKKLADSPDEEDAELGKVKKADAAS